MKTRVLILILLSGLALQSVGLKLRLANARDPAGIDFYHLWAIPTAPDLSRSPLGSPYRDPASYARVLNRQADADWRRLGVRPDESESLERRYRRYSARLARASPEFDRWFLSANLSRRVLDPTAPPLLYALFEFLPTEYSSAHHLYYLMQVAAQFLAVLLLWRFFRPGWVEAATLSLLLLVWFPPALDDRTIGNFNSIQLLLAVLCLRLSVAITASREPARQARRTAVLLSALATFTLLKPNFWLMAVLLGLSLWSQVGSATLARACVPASAFTLVILSLPCLYFGTATVWLDWLDFVIGSDTSKLAYADPRINYSPSLLLSRLFGDLSRLWITGALAALLVFSFLSVVWLSARRRGIAWLIALRARMRAIFADPVEVSAIAIVLTFALSPLVWFHYYTLGVIPLLVLLGSAERSGAAIVLAIAAFAMYSAPLAAFFAPPTPNLVASSAWLLLWIAFLLKGSASASERQGIDALPGI